MSRRVINRRKDPYRGSHLPVLMKVVQMTNGPIVELGCGTYSTQYLHWVCYTTKRRLVTYEDKPDYYPYAQQFASSFHEIRCVDNWLDIDLSEPWSIALVDYEPGPRGHAVSKLLHAEYVVCHDTEPGSYAKHQFDAVFPQFKYQWHYRVVLPHTSLLSNTHDLGSFSVP